MGIPHNRRGRRSVGLRRRVKAGYRKRKREHEGYELPWPAPGPKGRKQGQEWNATIRNEE